MQSQQRIGVEPMGMNILEVNALMKFGETIVDRIHLINIVEIFRIIDIIDKQFYKVILQMLRYHVPHKVIYETLVDETTQNCNLNHLIKVLYTNGYKDVSKELFLCYQVCRNEVTVCRVNRADTSNRRKIGKFFVCIKQNVYALEFNDACSDVHRMGQILKQLISNTSDPFEKMIKCDKFVALKAAEMDALTNTVGIVSKYHPGYLELGRYISSTTNPALSEVVLYSRQSDVLSTIGEFREAEDFMRQAFVSADTSCSCVEVTDMIYKNAGVKLSKFEKHPYDEELRQSILFEADRGLWTLESESNDLRIFWTKLFLLRKVFALLGMGKFCDIVKNYIPSMQSIFEAERILQLEQLKDVEHRRQMFIAVAKARLKEWRYDLEAAMVHLLRARELAKEGKYAEDRALAVYEIFLKKNSRETYFNQHKRQDNGIGEQNVLFRNLESCLSPSSVSDSTDAKTYSTTDNDSGTSLNISLEHLDLQSLLVNDCESVFSNISTNESLEHLDPISLETNYSQPSTGNTGAPRETYENFGPISNVVSNRPETCLDDDSYPSLEHLHPSSFES